MGDLSLKKRKRYRSLQQKKFRQLHGLFVAEGEHLVQEALNTTPQGIEVVLYQKGYVPAFPLTVHAEEISKQALAQISSLSSPPPILAIVQKPPEVHFPSDFYHGLSVGLDAVQDPGNMGAILRTCNWFGVRYMVCSEGTVDPYNPKSVQASMGAIFHLPCIMANLEEFLEKAPTDYFIAATTLHPEGQPIAQASMGSNGGMLLLGNEATGLSPSLEKFATVRLTIPSPTPQDKRVESLNVAAAAAICLHGLS